MTRLAFVILLATLSPAMAQDQPPPNLTTAGQGTQGGVARLFLSHQLFALGTAAKDPLTVLNAARLAASVTRTETTRAPDTAHEINAAAVQQPTSPADMFAAATTLAAENETLLDLIDTVRRETNYAPATVAVGSVGTISPAATQTWPVPFYGATLAEVAILETGPAILIFGSQTITATRSARMSAQLMLPIAAFTRCKTACS